MSEIDYVFPERKLFPISDPKDILIAIDAFKIFEDELSYSDFIFKLIKLAEKKGSSYVAILPNKIKKYTGIKKENKPESYDKDVRTFKKRPSRFIKEDYED